MNWKTVVNKQNAKHYAWPVGWDTADSIADQLECSSDRVREVLMPSIKNGSVEVKMHTVWDESSGRKLQKAGYRTVVKKVPPAKKR